MREISLNNQTKENSEDQNFLDLVFGIGEVTEICGLSATGKT
jgi:hypothetical protein